MLYVIDAHQYIVKVIWYLNFNYFLAIGNAFTTQMQVLTQCQQQVWWCKQLMK